MNKKKLRLFLPVLGLLAVLTFPACSFLDQYKDSPQYARFCEWQPIASTAIESAAMESLKDPLKQRVGRAMSDAANFLRLLASTCPKPA